MADKKSGSQFSDQEVNTESDKLLSIRNRFMVDQLSKLPQFNVFKSKGVDIARVCICVTLKML